MNIVHLSVVALVYIVFATVYLLVKWPQGADKSISQHAASQNNAYIFFSVSQTIVGLILYIFVLSWLIPRLNLSNVYVIVITTTAFLHISSTWIPSVNGFKAKLHDSLADAMAVCMLISTVLLISEPNVVMAARWFAAISAAYMLIISTVAIIALATNRMNFFKNNYLYLQATYVALFLSSILLAAVL